MAAFTFTNVSGMTIPNSGLVSQSLEVYGLTGEITGVSFNIFGLSHGAADDLDMLLAGPGDASNMIFWSDAGGNTAVNGDFVVSDAGESFLPDSTSIASGTFLPTDYSPAITQRTGFPFPVQNSAGPTGGDDTFASSFGGLSPNGLWTYHISDDTAGFSGDLDAWGLTIATNESSAAIDGTTGDDVVQIISTGLRSGAYSLNSMGGVSYSGVFGFRISTGAGNDTILGGNESDSINAGAGRDVIRAGAGKDDIIFDAIDDAGEIYDGGAGSDRFLVIATSPMVLDLRDDTVISIEGIRILNSLPGNSVTIRMNASQFGGDGFRLDGLITDDGLTTSSNTIEITMAGQTSLDMSAMIFNGFTVPGHRVVFKGGNAAETVTGTFVSDVFDLGADADIMIGGAGDDTYVLGADTSDTIIDSEGIDTITSTITRSLLNHSTIENLQLLGSANINGTGNALANTIIGNSGKNILDGGAGIDRMEGGLGDDIYIVDNAADLVIDAAGGGTDTVQASTSYTLRQNVSVEVLETGIATGTTVIHLTGNNDGQTINGNEAGNRLNGLAGNDKISGAGGNDVIDGGLNNDTLRGGMGDDTFVFSTALGPNNVDGIADFSNVTGNNDRIHLDDAIFTQLGANGALNANFFKVNAGGIATDADDYILYDTGTGKLFYDADGSGAGAAVHFATLVNRPALTIGDLFVV